jgi:hypothetical protein
MFLTMLSLLLLVSMVMWVINLGHQVDKRGNAQQSADAAAQAAAGWASRAVNSIAANNTDMARTLAVINVLDSFPQAVDFATRETQAHYDRLAEQLAAGIAEPDGALQAEVTKQFTLLASQISSDLNDNLVPVDNMFKTIDVREMTYYANDGYLWNSLIASDLVNQGIVESFGVAVQASAVEGGRSNLHKSDDADVVVVPAQPQLPHQRGSFEDFRRPVVNGMLPPSQDDPIEARGPWDAVFGWRSIISQNIPGSGGGSSPGSRSVVGGSKGGSPLSRGASSNGSGGGGTSIPIAYKTYGPHDKLLSWAGTHDYYQLEQSRFNYWLRPISNTKLNFVWPGSKNVPKIYDPDWRMSLDEAKQIQAAGTPQIRETMFFVVEIKSSIPVGGAGFLSSGTWSLAFEAGNSNPRVQIVGGFQNPETWAGVPKLNDWVWKDEWQYQVYWDASIGIQQLADGSGNPVAQDAYRYDFYIFGGVNVGPEAIIDNPYAGFNPGSLDAPSPMLLDRSVLPSDSDEAKFSYLKFLAIARQTDSPQAWASRFRGGRPYPHMVAVAQSRIFNDHSWDYWTQMWKAELEPVSNIDGSPGVTDWVQTLANSQSSSAADLLKYLQSLDQLASEISGH